MARLNRSMRFSGRPSALLRDVAAAARAPLTLGDRIGARIDDFVSVFSPSRGRDRAVRRARQFALDVAYTAASRRKQLSDWDARTGPPDSFLVEELPILRARARDLERNDPHGHALVEVKCDNVVGTGLRPQARASEDELELSADQVAEWNARCEEVWDDWAEHQADAAGLSDFADLQRLCYRGHMIDGEFLVHPVAMALDPHNGRTLPVALEVVAPERLSDPDGNAAREIPSAILARLRAGVEIGARQQPLAYWIADGNPDDRLRYPSLTWERVRRWRDGRLNLLHVFRRDAAEQSRGVPTITSTMSSFRHLAKYLEAEIVGARVAACIALFVKRTSAEDDPNFIDGTSDDGEPQKLQRMEPGIIEYLEPGEEIQQVVPQRPGSSFDPFVLRVLTAIAASAGVPYQLMLRDWSRTNYSSARAALLEARRGFRVDQARMVRGFCRPVRDLVLWLAYLQGELPVIPGAAEIWPKLMRASWVPPAWGWVDPVKEIQASEQAIAAGLSTLADEASSAGESWDDVLVQRARELQTIAGLEERYGLSRGSLVPGSLKGGAATPAAPAPDNQADQPADSQATQ